MEHPFDSMVTMQEFGHENVYFFNDEATHLQGVIAIHNTVLGPALGGTRLWTYANSFEALHDVLRLSRGMTYKSSAAGINLGGGKAVIMRHPEAKYDKAYWTRYGEFVERLGGNYITAADVGTKTEFMRHIASSTSSVAGKPDDLGGGGDPSPVTAYGVYLGMKASAKKRYGNDGLEGKRVMVQGVGQVGRYLVGHLLKEGADVLIADINEDNIKKTQALGSCQVVAPDTVYDQPMDIYAPCALGATLNEETIPRLQCSIVAGGANNQLNDEAEDVKRLEARDILYAPDFLINSGGVINCYIEVIGEYNRDKAFEGCERIYSRTEETLQYASTHGVSTHDAALALAQERIDQAKKLTE